LKRHDSIPRTAIWLAVTASLALACTALPVDRGHAPEGYAERPDPHAGAPFPNWPIPPDELDRLLRTEKFVVRGATGAGAGTTGAKKVEMEFPESGLDFDLKWKEMPGRWSPVSGRLDGVNNSPRKEIAAWVIQKLVLDPEDYVVPSTLAYCVPISDFEEESGVSTSTLDDTSCVLGVLALWLKELKLPKPLLDPVRFDSDYVYAYFMSNLNLVTYLMKHHDGREGNFLASSIPNRRQVFAIDNGVAFGGIFYNWFVANWNSIRVPALRKESIDRLRALTEQDFHAALGVVSQLELDDDGVYQIADPGPNLDPDDGVRREGRVLQLGLTEDEIEDVWERARDLIEDVDDGEIPVF
jgi:hypothetical protein